MNDPHAPWFRFARGDSPADLDVDRTDDDDDDDGIEPAAVSIFEADRAFQPDRLPQRKQNNNHG